MIDKENSDILIISDEIKELYPEAELGLLAINHVSNPNQHEGLDKCKIMLETDLSVRYSGLDRNDLKNLAPMKSYIEYYKRFKKTYHLLLQLESVVFKHKSIPQVASLVEIMFMAELKNLLLTAVHDLDMIELPIMLDAAKRGEKYIQLSGQEKSVIHHDMMISDRKGITSSIIYGPDKRTRIRPDTSNVLFVVYAPPGIEESSVFQHLQDIEHDVSIISPKKKVELLKVYKMKEE